MKQFVPLAIALALLWILLSGHFDALLLGFGLVSVIFVVWIAARMHIVDGESYPFGLIPRLSGFWVWLLVEIVKSNLDTVKRALGSAHSVQPVVFDQTATQQTDLGRVIHANSITLTPGTVSLDIDEHSIRVHALHPDVARSVVASEMDARVPDR